jgi:hypothetical protein
MVPKVDTFAKDISDEIKRKEASLTDIVSASREITNIDTNPPEAKKPNIIILGAVTFFIVAVTGIGGGLYYYLASIEQQQTLATEQQKEVTKKESSSLLVKLSPTLASAVGRSVSNVEVKNGGYIITISDYSSVFAYMTRNEYAYASEIIDVLNKNQQPTPLTNRSTTSTTSTTTATSTNATTSAIFSSTTIASVIEKPVSSWSDITRSNVNMRVYHDNAVSFVYAFISPKILIIARTPEEVLTIRSSSVK